MSFKDKIRKAKEALNKSLAKVDPTSKNSVVSKGLAAVDPTKLGIVKQIESRGIVGAVANVTGIKTNASINQANARAATEQRRQEEDREAARIRDAQALANQNVENQLLSTAVAGGSGSPAISKTTIMAVGGGVGLLLIVLVLFLVLKKK